MLIKVLELQFMIIYCPPFQILTFQSGSNLLTST